MPGDALIEQPGFYATWDVACFDSRTGDSATTPVDSPTSVSGEWWSFVVSKKTKTMNIIITGSLGHIGKPLTEELVQKGHHVTVISSKPQKQADIEAVGATAAIGSVEDVAFLTATFTGADAVFCMIPPNFSQPDQVTYYSRIGNHYA